MTAPKPIRIKKFVHQHGHGIFQGTPLSQSLNHRAIHRVALLIHDCELRLVFFAWLGKKLFLENSFDDLSSGPKTKAGELP